MKITSDKIAGLKQIYTDLAALTQESSDAILAAKDAGKENKVMVKRKDGTESEVREGALWEEVRYLGPATEGYEILKAKYPLAFDLGDKQRAKAEELSVFVKKELEIDPVKIRLIDIIEICEAVVEWKLLEIKQGAGETISASGSPLFPRLEDVLDHSQDELYDDAVTIVKVNQHASASLLQRKLKIGYARAANLLDAMEQKGVIGPANGASPRKVL